MRPDQIARLKDLSEKLADVVLEECDPDEWPGAGQPIASLSQQERGDRFWCKKNAAATFGLLQRTVTILELEAGSGPVEKSADDLEHEIAQAERQAAKMLDQIAEKSKAGKRGARA